MLALALLAMLAPRQDPPVDTFSSPSGAWTLTVTRKEKEWNGVVELVLVHDGVEAWRVEHELGLREACVSDDGRVAGYGYTGEGHDGHPGSEPDYPKGEDLRVFVLDVKGALVLDESHRRGAALYPDSDPNPVAAGGFLVPDLRRFVVRVHDEDLNRGAESWWAYDLDTGEHRFTGRPRLLLGFESRGAVIDVRPVPGTGLVLLQWSGGVFQLVDAELRAAWTLALPHDFDHFEKVDWAEWEKHGGSVHSTSDRTFDLRLAADGVIVRHGLERSADGWTVAATDRRPDPNAIPKPKARAKSKPRAR
jgi:hypothetical protein